MYNLSEPEKLILKNAREYFGTNTQIIVSSEELAELSIVCLKLARYDNEKEGTEVLHNKAIDEISDVVIVLDHIINIFGVSDDEIRHRVAGKIDRISRWVNSGESFQVSTKDRKVNEVK